MRGVLCVYERNVTLNKVLILVALLRSVVFSVPLIVIDISVGQTGDWPCLSKGFPQLIRYRVVHTKMLTIMVKHTICQSIHRYREFHRRFDIGLIKTAAIMELYGSVSTIEFSRRFFGAETRAVIAGWKRRAQDSDTAHQHVGTAREMHVIPAKWDGKMQKAFPCARGASSRFTRVTRLDRTQNLSMRNEIN